MQIKIPNRWTSTNQFIAEIPDDTEPHLRIRAAVEIAYKSGAFLRGAFLRGAFLRDADLRGADLRGAFLRGAFLRGADLRGADLRGADLRDADLRDADLRDADLRGADLTSIRDDLWAVLSAAPREVDGLRKALREGRVDGSTYEGECACLVGTIANVRGEKYTALGNLRPNSSRPVEVFFMSIRKGDTPETNPFSKLALEWADEWVKNIHDLLGLPPSSLQNKGDTGER